MRRHSARQKLKMEEQPNRKFDQAALSNDPRLVRFKQSRSLITNDRNTKFAQNGVNRVGNGNAAAAGK
jgi:hypothetical protein